MNILRNIITKLKKIARAKKIQPGQISPDRVSFVSKVFYLVFILIAGRAIVIQVFPSSKKNLENIAERQYQQKINLASYRGTIFDRRGIPLAISIKTPSLAINPQVFSPTNNQMNRIQKLLHISKSKIRKLRDKKSYFAWLKRKVPHQTAQMITSLDIPGLYKLMEPARFYPGGSSAANLIGYVGMDNTGLFGLEQKYDHYLKGTANQVIGARDARGNRIFYNSSKATPEIAGHDIHLTIDGAIQEIAQEALEKSVKEGNAKGGFAIVADPHTGRLLAMANYPTFDPNNTQNINIKNTMNQAISNVFEPGSVMKPFVIAEALERRKAYIDEPHNCEKSGYYRVGKRSRIHDDHPKEKLTTAEILVYSSNICTFKIAERIGPKALYNTYKKFGFATKKPILGLMGEQTGRISNWQNWKPIRFANIAFGQGHLVTGLEMTRAYGVLANGGNLVNPYLVEKVISESGKVLKTNQSENTVKVISPKTALAIRQSLEDVVTIGTAKLAATKNFTTGGKTGTAEKVDSETRTYSKTKRTASFSGFAPVRDPHIVIYVAIDEPGKWPYYGGKWAAPVFSEIAEKTLKYLNVAPDKEKLNTSKNGQHETKTKRM